MAELLTGADSIPSTGSCMNSYENPGTNTTSLAGRMEPGFSMAALLMHVHQAGHLDPCRYDESVEESEKRRSAVYGNTLTHHQCVL